MQSAMPYAEEDNLLFRYPAAVPPGPVHEFTALMAEAVYGVELELVLDGHYCHETGSFDCIDFSPATIEIWKAGSATGAGLPLVWEDYLRVAEGIFWDARWSAISGVKQTTVADVFSPMPQGLARASSPGYYYTEWARRLNTPLYDAALTVGKLTKSNPVILGHAAASLVKLLDGLRTGVTFDDLLANPELLDGFATRLQATKTPKVRAVINVSFLKNGFFALDGLPFIRKQRLSEDISLVGLNPQECYSELLSNNRGLVSVMSHDRRKMDLLVQRLLADKYLKGIEKCFDRSEYIDSLTPKSRASFKSELLFHRRVLPDGVVARWSETYLPSGAIHLVQDVENYVSALASLTGEVSLYDVNRKWCLRDLRTLGDDVTEGGYWEPEDEEAFWRSRNCGNNLLANFVSPDDDKRFASWSPTRVCNVLGFTVTPSRAFTTEAALLSGLLQPERYPPKMDMFDAYQRLRVASFYSVHGGTFERFDTLCLKLLSKGCLPEMSPDELGFRIPSELRLFSHGLNPAVRLADVAYPRWRVGPNFEKVFLRHRHRIEEVCGFAGGDPYERVD
jgi:hypothetical protein